MKKKKKYLIKCKYCHHVFEVSKCRKKTAKYCSKLCQNRFQAKYLKIGFKKGNTYGKFKRTKKHKKNMSLAAKGHIVTQKTKKKLSNALKGKIPWNKNKKLSKEHKRKIRLSVKKAWEENRLMGNKNKKLSKEHKRNISKNHWTKNPKFQGSNHPRFKVDKEKIIYSTLFNKEIKKLIFERDNYTCKICGKRGGSLCCHHIDYDKFNTALENLVTVCNKCHPKTNFNRKHWEEYFGHKHKIYSAFIGRFQLLKLHKGHVALIRTVLNEGKNVVILLRESSKDIKNPYGFYQRREGIEKIFKKEILNGKLIVRPMPDIEEVCYGRDVGWGIREIKLSKDIEAISASKIREKETK